MSSIKQCLAKVPNMAHRRQPHAILCPTLANWLTCAEPINGDRMKNAQRHKQSQTLGEQTRYIDPILGECWADVVEGGPTFTQHWVNASCLLWGERQIIDGSGFSTFGPAMTQCWRGVRAFAVVLEQSSYHVIFLSAVKAWMSNRQFSTNMLKCQQIRGSNQ